LNIQKVGKTEERKQIVNDEFVFYSDFFGTTEKVQTKNNEHFGRPIEKDYYLSEEGLCLAIMECRKPDGIAIKRQVGFRSTYVGRKQFVT